MTTLEERAKNQRKWWPVNVLTDESKKELAVSKLVTLPSIHPPKVLVSHKH